MFKKISMIVFSAVLMVLMIPINASAGENTTYSYTISVDGEWIRTQDAYMPSEILFRGNDLVQPNDIFISGDTMYVADTGNSRIVVINLKTKVQMVIGEGIVQNPMGLFVEDDGTVYVADSGAKAVLVLNSDGTLRQSIGRPEDSPLFSSQSVYEPKNVVVTSQHNIFVVGSGAHEGIMQFSSEGEFQGFFASNKREMTLLERIQELIFTDEQKKQLLNRTSRPIENIDITERDLICSVTQSAGVTTEWREAEKKFENRLKLHNMAGKNILAADEDISDEWNFVDVAAGPSGQLYALTYTGIISEFDSQGNLIFSFGGRAVSTDRNGLFTMAAAIDVDSSGFLYVLDKERGIVQVFFPTEYASVTHEALRVLEQGNYEDSEVLWQSILNLNGMSKIAHIGYGKSLFHRQQYSEALEQFRIANDKEDYSDVFWEIRNRFFNDVIPWFIGGLAAMYIIFKTVKILKRRKGTESRKKRTRIQPRFVRDLKDTLQMLRHPLDTVYDFKHNTRGSLIPATVIYIALTVVFAADMLFRGFLFSVGNLSDISAAPVIIMFVVPVMLWVIGNTMVASINEGEGSFKNIYISTAYSFSPYLIITPFVVLLSYGVTFNESVILDMVWIVGILWSAVLLFLSTMHTHNYTLHETVKNILLTVFFMLMAVVAVSIMYIMWNRLVQFIGDVFGEVSYHVNY